MNGNRESLYGQDYRRGIESLDKYRPKVFKTKPFGQEGLHTKDYKGTPKLPDQFKPVDCSNKDSSEKEGQKPAWQSEFSNTIDNPANQSQERQDESDKPQSVSCGKSGQVAAARKFDWSNLGSDPVKQKAYIEYCDQIERKRKEESEADMKRWAELDEGGSKDEASSLNGRKGLRITGHLRLSDHRRKIWFRVESIYIPRPWLN
ncbi:MAG: hypothetical protein MRJ65_06960 [Candidatus Brocadiaceae bacterium]|nr:hypothetical protein [Candidatus Brocadiaceae bacterium]